MISTNIRESEVWGIDREWKKGEILEERQPHFVLTHFLKSYCLYTHIYRESERERVCVLIHNI